MTEIYKTGNTIKHIKDINSAKTIAFFLDQTVAQKCSDSGSVSSSSGRLIFLIMSLKNVQNSPFEATIFAIYDFFYF